MPGCKVASEKRSYMKQSFGQCCKDLADAMHLPTSHFRVEKNGVLFLVVGSVQTPQGSGYFDQAVLFCPFCGSIVQDREEIARRASQL